MFEQLLDPQFLWFQEVLPLLLCHDMLQLKVEIEKTPRKTSWLRMVLATKTSVTIAMKDGLLKPSRDRCSAARLVRRQLDPLNAISQLTTWLSTPPAVSFGHHELSTLVLSLYI